MSFIYPEDLISHIKTDWENYQKQYKRTIKNLKIPAPSSAHLKEILDVLYHVSFLTEESRKISVKSAYFEPNNCNIKSVLNGYEPPIVFDKPIQYSVTEVLRLSPAFNSENTLLMVCPKDCVESGCNSSDLVIWGILYLGNDYINFLKGRSDAAMALPSMLTIGVSGPGNLTISASSRILRRLNGGQLIEASLSGINRGLIGESLSKSVLNNVSSINYFDNEKFIDRFIYSYFKTLTNIVRLTREKFHGGAVIIVPDNLTLKDGSLSNLLSIKYSIKSTNIWDSLANEAKATIEYFDIWDKDSKTIKNYEQEIQLESTKMKFANKIFEFEEFVASLTGIDGAVILNTKLDILGFGAEITVSNPGIEYIKEAFDKDGKTHKEIPINSFGTRHRSAFRLCSSIDDAIAFVVSQDGSVKAIKKEKNSLFLWKILL
ncbi:hypothetical protein CN513_23780 [Bacillus cereus]|uniref:putative sensor domain DACNV-containing protein n=1 Tax=Bacillus cereus group TaxID=86661 RepID=UPI000BF81A18|nr:MULTISPECIES: diadenylate cyclase [Bacillus cereus group]MBE5093545.1 DNA integrity scanning protein DisA nucleotide-binding domain protein [Bacillus thuringiensis]PET14228.1 hypothetical protein CN513_23780 [Bacillus cereus]PEV54196.1 hypothetical protein CN422_28970 [Bacillus cereus]PFQ51107.1 hypothetical protein COK24_19580 [Bacillus cereus]PFT53866.1 hypothetical protein COK67_30315 [Bacillus cereus]